MATITSDKIRARSDRLRLLKCFCKHLDLFDVKKINNFSSSSTELSIVSSWKNFHDAINWMRSKRIVSSLYSSRHIYVDLWHIRKESNTSKTKNLEISGIGAEKLMLHVVIQALKDVESKRPCDLYLWDYDISPDSLQCSSKVHICAYHAEKFLRSLDPEIEQFLFVSDGCILDILENLKKDSGISPESFHLIS